MRDQPGQTGGAPSAPGDGASDLESQVDDLLAEVTETVDEISRKLGHDEPNATSPDYTDSAALDNELAALADDPEIEDIEAQIIEPDENPSDGAAPESSEQVAPESSSKAPEEATGEIQDGAAPADPLAADSVSAPASDQEPIAEPADEADGDTTAEPVAEQAEETVAVSADDTGALEDELAALANGAPSAHEATEAHPEPDAQTEHEAESVAEPEPQEPEISDAAPEEAVKVQSPDYTDTGALEDELAALAADTDLDDEFIAQESVAPEAPEPEAPATDDGTPANALDDELAALAAEALDEDLESTAAAVAAEDAKAPTEPLSEQESEQVEQASPPANQPPQTGQPQAEQPGSTESAPTPQTKAEPKPETTPASPLKWGWLPPKPEWPEVYSKARPLVIAGRHAAWVIPPLLAFLGSLAWTKSKTAAIKAEPHARHAVAVAATPLSSRDERTRSIIGWFAIYTFFVATCLWIYVLIGRSPAVPESTTTPTTLTGQPATTTADADR